MENYNKINSNVLGKYSYILVKNKGVILLENCTKSIEEMLVTQAKVLLRLKISDDLMFLNDNDCEEIINWDAEKYRKSLDAHFSKSN